MSENLSLPAARVPLVDDQGRITREWMSWFIGMFRRAGGPQGLSNNELYGDAAAQQSYNELLGRVGAAEALARGQDEGSMLQELLNRLASLEAQNRSLTQDLRAVGMMLMDQPASQSAFSEVMARLEIRGDTRLATELGNVLIGLKTSADPELLQVAKDLLVNLGARLAVTGGRVRIGAGADDGTNKLQVDGGARIDSLELDALDVLTLDAISVNTSTVNVAGNQVVSGRKPGIPALSAYAGQTMDATYNQSQAQAADNALKAVSAALSNLITALRSHGLVGN